MKMLIRIYEIEGNLLIIILGWEAVGIVSYLLVNFWYTRLAANMAS